MRCGLSLWLHFAACTPIPLRFPFPNNLHYCELRVPIDKPPLRRPHPTVKYPYNRMRALLLMLVLVSTAAAQSAPTSTIAVVDENGVAVSSARITLESPTQPEVRCQTTFTGRCQFPTLAPGQYHIHVEKEGLYALDQPPIQVEPSREPAEAGKGSAGLLMLNTGIGDDHFRFSATDFLPSFINRHGWRFDQFLPRFTFSGPIAKGKIWFYNAFDGEYNNQIYTELPRGADNDHILRLGNLTKLQANLTNRNILTTSFLINDLHDQYAFLSPQSPQPSNPKNDESAYVASIKDQHYFPSGDLLATGFAFVQYNTRYTPYGASPYFVNTNTTGGNYYLTQQTNATRWQGIANVYLQPQQWYGRHDFKFGIDLDRIDYDARFFRRPISFLTDNNRLTTPDLCF